MPPIRLAFLPPSLRPGGAERQMLALALRLPRECFAVEFVSVSGVGEYDQLAIENGIPVRSLGGAPPLDAGPLSRIARRGWKMLRYGALARHAGYDIVDGWLNPSDVMAAVMRRVAGTAVVVSGRRNLGDFDDGGDPVMRRLSVWADQAYDAVVGNSEAVVADTLRRGRVPPGRIHLIRNGVKDIAPLTPAERRMRRSELGQGDEAFLVGCVANYREVKRQDVLIRAFGELAVSDPMARLVLIGEGPDRDSLQHLIDELGLSRVVSLVGSVPDPIVYYGALDLVVQSSRSEGLPNAMLEASAAGRPIIATDVGGTSEIVIDGKTGVLVPPANVGALAAAMRRLAADGDLRTGLAAAARRHTMARFGMDRFVDEFATLYDRLLAAKRSRLAR